MQDKKIKKRIYSSIINQQIEHTEFLLIEAQLKKTTGKEEKKVFKTNKISKSISIYSENLTTLLKQNVNCETTLKTCFSKKKFIEYINKKRELENYLGIVKYKRFLFKLPQANLNNFKLTTSQVIYNLNKIYINSIKIILLGKSKKNMKL